MRCSNEQKESLQILGREIGKEIKIVRLGIRNETNLITQIPYHIDIIFQNIVITVAQVIICSKMQEEEA